MAIEKSEILLESGTNEIEIMEFMIADVLYGINVAKVREIMISEPVKYMPHTHPAVEGIFKPGLRQRSPRGKRSVHHYELQPDEHRLSRAERGGDQPYFMEGYPEAG